MPQYTVNYIILFTDLLYKTWKLHRVTQLWNFSYSKMKYYGKTLTRYMKVTTSLQCVSLGEDDYVYRLVL